MFLFHDTIFSSGSVTLVGIVMSGKKIPGKPKLPKFRHIWLQDSELRSWPSAYCLSCWFKKSFAKFAI